MIVLDTHAWLWWLGSPGQLSPAASRLIEQHLGAAGIYVSSMSSWEIAMLAKKGRLELAMPVADWIARSEALPFLGFVPVDNHIAVRSVQLNGEAAKDPADRIIIATALCLGACLVTKDRKIRDDPGVETVW